MTKRAVRKLAQELEFALRPAPSQSTETICGGLANERFLLSTVGDHFFIGLKPTSVLDDRDRALLRDLRPAGVILYKSNFRHDLPYRDWLSVHRDLIAAIRDASQRDKQFIAIDHEGGRVCRTPAPITRFSYAARWAGTAEQVGDAMGVELASLGCNLNFAPVLDIHSNPANPVIGERAFGRTADDVIKAMLPFAKAMERRGVRACGKHFPGHGDTQVDSHHELPVIDLDLDQIKARELKPFAAAIEGGIEMMMTSHILYRKLDANDPVTLSRAITQGLLREAMNFRGVIVSDDVGMRAMAGRLDAPDAGARFMAAGNDMLMICSALTDTGRARFLAQSIIDGVDSGKLDPAVLKASSQRVHAMLDRTPQNSVSELSPEVLASHRNAGAQFEAATVEVV